MMEDNEGCLTETIKDAGGAALIAQLVSSSVIIWKEYGWIKGILIPFPYLMTIVLLGFIAGAIPIVGQFLYLKFAAPIISQGLLDMGISPDLSWAAPIWLEELLDTEIRGTLLDLGYWSGFLLSIASSIGVTKSVISEMPNENKQRILNKVSGFISWIEERWDKSKSKRR